MTGTPMYPFSRLAGKALKTAFSLAGMEAVMAFLPVDDVMRFMSDYHETTLLDEKKMVVGWAYLLSPSMVLKIDESGVLIVSIDGGEPTGDIEFRYEIILENLDPFIRPEKLGGFYPEELELPPGLKAEGRSFTGKVGFTISEEELMKLLTLPPKRNPPAPSGWSGIVIKAHGPPRVRGQ